MSTIDTRREQMFAKLQPREIDRLRRFGEVRRYSAGEALFVTGEIAPGMCVLIKGSGRVTRRDPLTGGPCQLRKLFALIRPAHSPHEMLLDLVNRMLSE